MSMTIGGLAGWFGSKRTMAPAIVRELGPHVQYFEPFCGSMAVLFAKGPSRQETVNDLHGDLINLALVVADEADAAWLYEKLHRTLFHEGLLSECGNKLDSEWCTDTHGWDRERAYWYFLASWMGRGGDAGTDANNYAIAVRWTPNGGSPTVRFRSAIESIPAWHQRLRGVVILNRDAFKIVGSFEDAPHTAIYVDPPYMKGTRNAGRYKFDFGGEGELFGDDHCRLAAALREFKHARIVVSYYDCPRVRELYEGWTFVDHSRHKHLHVASERGSGVQKAPEVLIVNGNSHG